MKKITLSLVFAFTMLLSVNAFAQKSVATINTSTGSKMVDEKTTIVTFDVSNVASEVAKKKIADAFKSCQSVFDASGTLHGTTATYSVKMAKTGSVRTMQAMLVKAEIETVNLDGTVVESAKLVEHKQKIKKENSARKK